MSGTDEPATASQIGYLQVLRRRVGLDRWNETKANLGIDQPGTYGLTKHQAGKLIAALIGDGRESR
jgi:hypothetical protein